MLTCMPQTESIHTKKSKQHWVDQCRYKIVAIISVKQLHICIVHLISLQEEKYTINWNENTIADVTMSSCFTNDTFYHRLIWNPM